jgi:hypothetical protein
MKEEDCKDCEYAFLPRHVEPSVRHGFFVGWRSIILLTLIGVFVLAVVVVGPGRLSNKSPVAVTSGGKDVSADREGREKGVGEEEDADVEEVAPGDPDEDQPMTIIPEPDSKTQVLACTMGAGSKGRVSSTLIVRNLSGRWVSSVEWAVARQVLDARYAEQLCLRFRAERLIAPQATVTISDTLPGRGPMTVRAGALISQRPVVTRTVYLPEETAAKPTGQE